MISTVFEIFSAIELRRFNRWENLTGPAPTTQQTNEALTLLTAFQNLDVSYNRRLWLDYLERLVKCHQELSIECWPRQRADVPKLQMDWYLSDLFFYCGLSHSLMQSYRILVLNEWQERLPPMSSFVPNLEDDGLLDFLLSHTGNQHAWLGQLKEVHEMIPFRREMRSMVQVAQQYREAHPLVELLLWFPDERIDLRLRTMADERRQTSHFNQVCSFLMNKMPMLSDDEKGRSLVRCMLDNDLHDDVYILKVISVYKQSVIEKSGAAMWQKELDYWKHSNSRVGHLIQCHVAMLQSIDKCWVHMDDAEAYPDKLRWLGSGEELARIFVELTKKGQIRCKGNGDITPVALKLFKMFEIDKVKGGGTLTQSSFVSYCKRISADVR
jgi:hypothetical protein